MAVQEKAVEICKLEGFTGDARLYRLTKPLDEFDFVVVSATTVPTMFGGDETYIFGANEDGEVQDWSELEGSFKGSRDHIKALRNAGYEIETLGMSIEADIPEAPLPKPPEQLN